ncbi:MAG TPA: hydantoinase/oxoprolinase family protein [Thermomicrobiaceae bacterium]|nr:hydantoinase/oxoprolinase family protein [Thermomicrobiaceae bacterium]
MSELGRARTSLRLGIDVGGTNTDAVVLDEQARLLASFKSPTTADVMSGVRDALAGLVANHPELDLGAIRHAMLGTTACTNAILERRNLNRVGLIRVGYPSTLAIKPFVGWPADLREAIGGHYAIVEGGHEYDGREILPLDVGAVRKAAESFMGKVDALAVVSVFSPVDADHERRAAEVLRGVLGDLPLTYSYEIGSIGLLERENASILNAAVINAARTAAEGFAQALRQHGIDATLFFSQNDGTLMALDYAVRYPILTVASGPANSIRGAAFLSGLQDGIVVDVGGTSTDVGILVHGFPRESAIAVDIGGVRTNFRMPDLISIALGGGSRIRHDGALRIGPDSVGYRITRDALVFGGDTLTLSDVAVAGGRVAMGDPSRVSELAPSLVSDVTDRVREMVEDVIDRMKTSADSVPVVLVGGGSVVIPTELAGASEIRRPDHYDVANAIGAAIAQCSGEIERVFSLAEMTRDEALAAARRMAHDEAVRAGAAADTVEIVDVHEVPLAYLPGNATRIRVRAAGALAVAVAP